MKTQQSKKIVWEKWKDPYGVDDIEWPGAHGDFKSDEIIHKVRAGEIDEDEYTDKELDDAHEELQRQAISNKLKNTLGFLNTPMGVVPIMEHSRAGNLFNFWTAHTNFRMTQTVLDILNDTPGVETLDVFTPYRWRVSIGRAFDTTEVKLGIQENLGVHCTETEE